MALNATKFIFTEIINRGYPPEKIEKFIQELAWRDYWQQIWNSKGDTINQDLKHKQYPVSNHSISTVINKGNTGIHAIDTAINKLPKSPEPAEYVAVAAYSKPVLSRYTLIMTALPSA